MKILIACELSGVVRDAFIRKGHDAISCDIEPTESDFGPHIQGDVTPLLKQDWDMVIAFPPCTHLAVSGARYFKDKGEVQKQAIDFFLLFPGSAPKVAIENPVGIISTHFRKPNQYIQPWEFGHEETKKTGLWLEGLPLLRPTNIMEIRNRNLTPSGQNKLGPSADRAKLRSMTYQGIADAMANQWG